MASSNGASVPEKGKNGSYCLTSSCDGAPWNLEDPALHIGRGVQLELTAKLSSYPGTPARCVVQSAFDSLESVQPPQPLCKSVHSTHAGRSAFGEVGRWLMAWKLLRAKECSPGTPRARRQQPERDRL